MMDHYFTVRDIIKVYPNNIGIQTYFKSFMNRKKIRAVGTKRVSAKIDTASFGDKVSVKCYDPHMLIEKFEAYVEESGYKIDSHSKGHIAEILVLLRRKIEESEKGSIGKESKG